MDRLLKYRWTRQEAVLDLSKHAERPVGFLIKSDQPYIKNHPVKVEFLQQGSLIGSFTLFDHRWRRVSISGRVYSKKPLIIRVNQTWNPRREGYGDDPRDLGVAVALLPLESRDNNPGLVQ